MELFDDISLDVRDSGAISKSFNDVTLDNNVSNILIFSDTVTDNEASCYKFNDTTLDNNVPETYIHTLERLK